MRSFAILGAVLSAIVDIASAYTQPVGEPSGNPIARPGLHEKVPVGKPYTITWNVSLPSPKEQIAMEHELTECYE